MSEPTGSQIVSTSKESQLSMEKTYGSENGEGKSTVDNESIVRLEINEAEKNENNVSKLQLNCYCGKDRNLNIVELLCANCNIWFHESCISYQLGKSVAFLVNYIFLCKNCSPTKLESFRKFQAQISQMCITAIANLQQSSLKEGQNRTVFSKDKEIIPYIEHHWEALTTTPRRITQSWHTTLRKALVKDIHILFVFEESTNDGQMYGLLCNDLTQIKPNYGAMIKGGMLKVTATGIQDVPVVGGAKSRNAKRKFPNNAGSTGKKGRQVELGAQKLPAHGYPLDHPFNKDGYRYLLAEPDPHAPYRQEFDESNDWAGKPIPGWLYRILVPNTVLLTLHDRAPQLKISEDRLSATGERGYCMVRATHWVNIGSWYWEATVEEMPIGSAVRLGWGQDYANLQAPLGYDKFGYSWRSKKGTKFHQSAGKHYSSAYGKGDTLGFLIILPETSCNKIVPNTYKDRPLVKVKSHLYYEDKDHVSETLKNLKILPGSKIVFFKNGVCQGVAFTNIYAGSYYPALSLYKSATVSVNFGPNFKHLPNEEEYQCRGVKCAVHITTFATFLKKGYVLDMPNFGVPFLITNNSQARPWKMHQRVEEAICEHTFADVMYLTENEGKLRLDTFVM